MVTAYPVTGKAKSVEICAAFIAGCGGGAELGRPDKLHSGAAFFYGVDSSNVHLWEQVLREEREFYYCDNAYFDSCRQQYFRVTHNAIQHQGTGSSDGARFAKLNIPVAESHDNPDGHVVLCPQSDWFMDRIARYGSAPDAWLNDAVHEFRRIVPGRELRVRHWSPDKAKLARSLPDDLVGAWALVTHSSAAAVTALLAGIPVYCSDACAAMPLASVVMNDIPQRLFYGVETRKAWAEVLADNQWTLDEMRSGRCWTDLQR